MNRKKRRKKRGPEQSRAAKRRRLHRIQTKEIVFAASLPKECERCGACCMAFAVTLNDKDLEREPRLREHIIPQDKLLEHVQKGFVSKYNEKFAMSQNKERCPFLEQDDEDEACYCTIYETRPHICRRFVASLITCRVARLELLGYNIKDAMDRALKQNVAHPVIIAQIMRIDMREAESAADSVKETIDGLSK